MTLEQAKEFIKSYLLLQKPTSWDKEIFKIALKVVSTIRRPE